MHEMATSIYPWERGAYCGLLMVLLLLFGRGCGSSRASSMLTVFTTSSKWSRISGSWRLDADTLAGAIAATLFRHGMVVPTSLPVGLTDEFSGDVTRQALWHAFLKKNELARQALPDVVVMLRASLGPALLRAAELNVVQK